MRASCASGSGAEGGGRRQEERATPTPPILCCDRGPAPLAPSWACSTEPACGRTTARAAARDCRAPAASVPPESPAPAAVQRAASHTHAPHSTHPAPDTTTLLERAGSSRQMSSVPSSPPLPRTTELPPAPSPPRRHRSARTVAAQSAALPRYLACCRPRTAAAAARGVERPSAACARQQLRRSIPTGTWPGLCQRDGGCSAAP